MSPICTTCVYVANQNNIMGECMRGYQVDRIKFNIIIYLCYSHGIIRYMPVVLNRSATKEYTDYSYTHIYKLILLNRIHIP